MAATTVNNSVPRANRSQNISYADLMKPDEDWRMLPDASERRKIQNRLAQRAYRRNMRDRTKELERLKRQLEELQHERSSSMEPVSSLDVHHHQQQHMSASARASPSIEDDFGMGLSTGADGGLAQGFASDSMAMVAQWADSFPAFWPGQFENAVGSDGSHHQHHNNHHHHHAGLQIDVGATASANAFALPTPQLQHIPASPLPTSGPDVDMDGAATVAPAALSRGGTPAPRSRSRSPSVSAPAPAMKRQRTSSSNGGMMALSPASFSLAAHHQNQNHHQQQHAADALGLSLPQPDGAFTLDSSAVVFVEPTLSRSSTASLWAQGESLQPPPASQGGGGQVATTTYTTATSSSPTPAARRLERSPSISSRPASVQGTPQLPSPWTTPVVATAAPASPAASTASSAATSSSAGATSRKSSSSVSSARSSNNAADAASASLLHLAVASGHAQVLRTLLAKSGGGGGRAQMRAMLDVRDAEGYTPLQRAVWAGREEMVALLLEAGADLDVVRT